MGAARARRRRIDGGEVAGPTMSRWRFWCLRGLRARFLWPDDEDEDGKALGQGCKGRGARWSRVRTSVLRRSSRASPNRAREEGEDDEEGGNGVGKLLGVSRRRDVA